MSERACSQHHTQAGAIARWPDGSPRAARQRSERERLRPAIHLGATMLADRLDRRAGQRLVSCEQPAQRIRLVETAVKEQCQRAVQSADDLMAIEECSGHAERAIR